MDTRNAKKVPFLEESEDYVILLPNLEFAMSKSQLKTITELHNEGMWIEDIAEEVKRNPYEVLIALIHQVMRGAKVKPLAYRGRKYV